MDSIKIQKITNKIVNLKEVNIEVGNKILQNLEILGDLSDHSVHILPHLSNNQVFRETLLHEIDSLMEFYKDNVEEILKYEELLETNNFEYCNGFVGDRREI